MKNASKDVGKEKSSLIHRWWESKLVYLLWQSVQRLSKPKGKTAIGASHTILEYTPGGP